MSANEIKTGIKIEVQTNGTEQIKQLNQAIDDVPESLQKAREQAEKLKQVWQQDSANQNAKMAYVRAAGEVKQLEQTLQSLQAQTEQSGQSLDYFAKKAEKLQSLNQDKQTLGLDIDEQARQEIDKLNQAFIRLKASGTLSQKELARAADLHRDKIYRLEKSLSYLRPSLSDVVDEVQGLVTRSAGLAYAANEAMKFETAMAAVKKVTDGTGEQYGELEERLKALGGQLGIMPEQLAQIAAQGGQMGIAMERLPEFTEMAAQMSVAFGISAEAAGEMAAKTANVFELNQEGMRALGDAVNTLGNTTAAKEAEIAEVLLRIGGNSKQFGLAAEEAAALGAAFISLGKTPEVAGTAINAMLAKLQNAKLQGNEFQVALKDIGLSAEDMAERIAANPQQALNDFLQRIAQLDNQARSETLGQLFGAEYADDIALLTGSLNTYTDALANATDRQKTFGAMQKETEAAMDTTAKRIEQAKVQVANAAIELGNALLPAIQSAAGAVGSVADTLGDIGQQFPVLTQLAALFMGAKLAVTAYQTAMRLSGQESQAAFLKSDVGATKLKASILEAAAAAKLLGANMKAAVSGDVHAINVKVDEVGKLKSALAGAAQGALSLWSAFEAGQGVGTALRESSDFVRDLGDNMAQLIAYADALFTDRSWDDVNQMFRTSRQEAREAEQASRAAAKAAAEKAAAEQAAAQEQARAIEALQQKRRQLTDAIQANEHSLTVLNQAGLESGATAEMLTQKNEDLRQKLAQVSAQLQQHNAQIGDVSPFAKQREALKALGLDAEQAASGISASARAALADFALAGAQFGTDADSMARVFQAALAKMNSPEAVAQLKQSLADVGKQAGLTEADIRRIGSAAPEVADEVSAAFAKIGVDTAAVMQGVSTEAKQAMADFQAASDAAKEKGINDSRLIAAGFEQMLAKLKSPEEFAAFRQQLNDSGQAAKLTSEQLARLNVAAEKGASAAKTAYEQLSASLKNAADTAALQAAAHEAEAAMKRGEIGAAQYQQILAEINNQTDALTQKNRQMGQSSAAAHQQASRAAQQASASLTDNVRQSATSAQQATQAAEQTAVASDKTAQSAKQTAISARAAGESAQQSAQGAQAAAQASERALAAVAQRRGLEGELARLQGDDDLAKRLAQEQKVAEIRQKINEAQQAGDAQAVAEYQRVLALQRQIFAQQQHNDSQSRSSEQPRDEAADTSSANSTATASQPSASTRMADVVGTVATGMNELLSERDKRLIEMALNELMNRLQMEMKRM